MSSTRLYPPTHYDNAFRLKVPFLLWMAFINGLLHLVCLFPPAQTAFGKTAALLGDWRLVGADVIVLCVLIASGFRVPEARPWMRRMWHGGRAWLIGAYVLDLLLFGFFHGAEFGNPDLWYFDHLVVIVAVSLALLFYLLRSQLVRDVFADFPEPGDDSRQRVVPVAVAARKREAEKLLVRYPGEADDGELAAQLRSRLIQDSENAGAWHDLGLIALQQGVLEQACEFVQQAVSIDGANGIYLRNLAELYRRAGKLEEAHRAGLAAVRLQPKDADAHYNLALVWAQAGRFQEAEASYRSAIEFNPRHANAWNNLGVLYRHVGNEDAARRAFEQALALAPTLLEAAANLKGNPAQN
ncbi:MAG TPA: DUF2919 family protein [Rhodocyclaceae bacterium]|nr:DUF2919 family protein [Rhodocyclaceae bacterium]